jgi:hypothetical protein
LFKIFFKPVKEILFLIGMKRIYDLVRKTNESINIVDILSDRRGQHSGGQAKGGTVRFGNYLTAAIGNNVENRFHPSKYYILLTIKSDTNLPEIRAGGTPGPGTVNCPVKNRFFTFLLRNRGLKNAVCDKVFAIP